MNKPRQLSAAQVQWIIWILLLIIHIGSLLSYDSWAQATVNSLITVSSYVIILYGNALVLIPRLYVRGYRLLYVLCSLIFIGAVGVARLYTSFYLYNRFFAKQPMPFRWAGAVYSMVSLLLIFITGILFYIAMNYSRLRRKQEELQKKNAETELNLLKAQVQPHFLFNTLNNIYSIAQRESPATAALLDQLSAIMRYFVDEAPKDRVKLQEELSFVKGYIELEKLRMRYPLDVRMEMTGIDPSVEIPPMVLIPLVENVFKHGIDKKRNDNFIHVSIIRQNNRLIFDVHNRVAGLEDKNSKSQTGLPNLKSRLELIYGTDYNLRWEDREGIFEIQLNIPV